jgi:hypothetical protein
MVKADRSMARNALTTRSEPYHEKVIHAELTWLCTAVGNIESTIIGSK